MRIEPADASSLESQALVGAYFAELPLGRITPN